MAAEMKEELETEAAEAGEAAEAADPSEVSPEGQHHATHADGPTEYETRTGVSWWTGVRA